MMFDEFRATEADKEVMETIKKLTKKSNTEEKPYNILNGTGNPESFYENKMKAEPAYLKINKTEDKR